MNMIEKAICQRLDNFFNAKSHLNLILHPERIWNHKGKSYILFNVQGYFLHLPDNFIGNPNNPDHALKQLKNLSPSVKLLTQIVLPFDKYGNLDCYADENVEDFLKKEVFFIPHKVILYVREFHKKTLSFHSPKLSHENIDKIMRKLYDWFKQKLNENIGDEILMQAILILVGKDFIHGFKKVYPMLPKAGDIRSFLHAGIDNDPTFDEYIVMFEEYLKRT